MFKSLLKGAAIAVAATAMASSGASAGDYPDKSITLIIPLGAGGSHDLNARVFTSIIPQYLGQPVVVKLMPGASGQTGTAAAARARPDGYTLLFTHNFFDQLQQYVTKLPYDPNKDFVPVVQLNSAFSCTVTKPGRPFKTWDDMIAYAKANPGEIELAHSGQWGSGFMHAALLQKNMGVRFNMTPYPGGGPAMKALLSDDAQMTMAFPITIGSVGGGVYPMACAAPNKEIDAEFPGVPIYGKDIPEMAGVGFMRRVVLAPAGIPEDRLQTLRKAFADLQGDKTFKRLMGRLGEQTNLINGPEYQKLREEQAIEYKALVETMTKG